MAGQDYSVSVNIPVGPTDISPGTLDLRYSQKFYVYRISGVVGGPFVQVVDVDAANGLVRLGDNGNQTSVVYQPVANQIVIELLNTTPLDTDGTTLDPNANVGNELVYADAAGVYEPDAIRIDRALRLDLARPIEDAAAVEEPPRNIER